MDLRASANSFFSILAAGGIAALIGAPVADEYQSVLLWCGAASAAVGIGGVVSLLASAKKAASPPPVPHTQYTITNTGSGAAIGHAGSVHIGRQRFELTDEVLATIRSELDPKRPVALFWVSTGRTPAMALKLKADLLAHGFTLGGEMSWGHGPVALDEPLVISSNGIAQGGATIFGGMQVVGLDASAA